MRKNNKNNYFLCRTELEGLRKFEMRYMLLLLRKMEKDREKMDKLLISKERKRKKLNRVLICRGKGKRNDF